MTRKDYVLIAEALSKAADRVAAASGLKLSAPDGVNLAAREIAESLSADNPAFKRVTFLKAAGVVE